MLLMKIVRGGFPGTSPRPGEGEGPSSGRTAVLLPILLLLLSFLLVAGWQVATSPRDNGQVKEAGEPASGDRSPGEKTTPGPDLSWEERTKRWKQILGESARTIGKDPPEDGPATDQDREEGTVWMEVKTLDGTLAAGDQVEVIWSSPDGAEWKKVTGQTLTVQGIHEDMVRLKVTTEAASLLTSARSRGRIFAVPP
jgi:hypothetical protein